MIESSQAGRKDKRPTINNMTINDVRDQEDEELRRT